MTCQVAGGDVPQGRGRHENGLRTVALCINEIKDLAHATGNVGGARRSVLALHVISAEHDNDIVEWRVGSQLVPMPLPQLTPEAAAELVVKHLVNRTRSRKSRMKSRHNANAPPKRTLTR
jgi:hypothetical protein